jgi:hypothetical protein
LSPHRRDNPEPGALHLTFRLGAQHHDQRLMGRVVVIDRPVRLGQPQLHSMLFEHRRQVLQLIGGERPLVLADHNRVEPAIRVVERGQQRSGLRTLPPTAAARAADIEVFGDDRTVSGDEFSGAVPLPVPGRHPVLVLDGRHPTVERKPQTRLPMGRRLRIARLGVEPTGQRIEIVALVVGHADIPTKNPRGRGGQAVR